MITDFDLSTFIDHSVKETGDTLIHGSLEMCDRHQCSEKQTAANITFKKQSVDFFPSLRMNKPADTLIITFHHVSCYFPFSVHTQCRAANCVCDSSLPPSLCSVLTEKRCPSDLYMGVIKMCGYDKKPLRKFTNRGNTKRSCLIYVYAFQHLMMSSDVL